MAYFIYTSEAVILKRRDIGEADSIFSVFTKNFGRIEAFSRGIRLLKSKLRYNLSYPAVLRLSFISTQNGFWQIVDSNEIRILKNVKRDATKAWCVFAIFSMLERLLQGQEEDLDLWEEVKGFLEEIDEKKHDASDLKNFSIYAGLKILSHLGYADRDVYSGDFSLEKVKSNKVFFSELLKQGIESSHL